MRNDIACMMRLVLLLLVTAVTIVKTTPDPCREWCRTSTDRMNGSRNCEKNCTKHNSITVNSSQNSTTIQMAPQAQSSTTISTQIVPQTQRSTAISTQTQSINIQVTSTPPPSSSNHKPANDNESMDDEGLPLYAIIGGAAGGGLILVIIVLLLILCYLIRRLMKAERKERPSVNGDTAQHSPSSEEHTDRSRESPPSTSPVFHNPTYDGEVKSHPKTGASGQDRMYDTVSDEEAKKVCPAPRYSEPPSSLELDASYAYVSHDICRKKALRVSSGDPRKQLPRDPAASTETSEPQGYSEPIERTAAIEESGYSYLCTAVISSSKRHSAPLLNSNESVYDHLDNGKGRNARTRYSHVSPLSRALEYPQPARQPQKNHPGPQHQTTLDHIYHVLESTPPASPSTAIGSPLPVLPYLSSEPEHGASNTYPQNQPEIYDTINEVTVPQAIYDTPVDIPKEIYDEVK